MGWLYLILFGLVAGGLAKFIMPGKDPGGIIVTILLGIAGSMVGGFIGSALGIANPGTGFDLMSLIFAVAGALLLLFLYRMFMARRSR